MRTDECAIRVIVSVDIFYSFTVQTFLLPLLKTSTTLIFERGLPVASSGTARNPLLLHQLCYGQRMRPQAGRREPPPTWESETEIRWRGPRAAPSDDYRETGQRVLPT